MPDTVVIPDFVAQFQALAPWLAGALVLITVVCIKRGDHAVRRG